MWPAWTWLALGFASVLQTRARSASIDAFIAKEMPAARAPGLAYAVLDNGNVESDARGEMLIGSGKNVTPETPFLLGSISKSFTALAVMQLMEAGKIDLDTSIAHYLTAFAGRPSAAITVRQLLSHTSGFSTLQGNHTHADLARGTGELTRHVRQIAEWTPAHQPSVTWEYSNANYEILGALIESVTGQEYERYVETEILAPIGMRHSFVADGERHEEMATGHRPWFGTRRPMEGSSTRRVVGPAGGVIASATDLARYLAIMMNGEDDIISAQSKAAMMRPASTVSPFYGFGWFIDPENGTVFHSGSSPGTETLATMRPAKRTAAVVLVNAGSGIGFGETAELRDGITARALGLDYAGEGKRWPQKATFVALVLLPLAFLCSIVWAWIHRAALRSKSGPFGLFSLWFPLCTTSVMAWALVDFIPHAFGISMGTLRLFQPDLALLMAASAVIGVAWATFRLGVAYSGRSLGH